MAQEFRHLFSPLKIGSMTVKNRFYSSTHNPGYSDPGLHGFPNEKIINYYAAKAKGGVGLVGLLYEMVHTEYNVFRLPKAREAFKRAADAVHQHGAKVVCQICHLGGQQGGFGAVPKAPSPVPTPSGSFERYTPHELTREEIKEIVDNFAYGASVVKEAGIDAVEIHGAHGYLLTEFMSPYFNRRTDEYGGSLENRMRFPLEIIDAVRSAVGSDFVVGMRVCADEFIEGGYTLDGFLVMAPMLTKTSKLNYLNVSAGTYTVLNAIVEPMYFPLSSFVYCAAAVKQVVDIPVVARGRINDPVQAEQIIANNQADMVSMVRAIVADPELPNKAREGRLDEIRKCIGCNEGCWGTLVSRTISREGDKIYFGAMTCTMNPTLGKEGQPGWGELEPARVKKKVMVIGGGPAGLETARVATLRGHQVSLYEKGSELGGQTLIAAKAPGRDGFLDLPRYYNYQMKLLNVDVHLNTEVTPQMVKKLNPDVVVVATGSVPFIPDIPGIDGDNVVEARRLLNEEVAVGNNVVIIGGDEDIQSLSTADFLAERGKRVELLSTGFHCGSKIEPLTKLTIYQRLFQKGVTLTPHTGVREIAGNTVIAYNVFSNVERRIEDVDTVIIAYGGRENNALYYTIKGQVKEIYKVGDAAGVRRIHHATADGAMVGRTL